MYLKKNSFIKFSMYSNCIYWRIFLFLSFDFFLLRPCTAEQWLAYHWWYAYHTLRYPVIDDLNEQTARQEWREYLKSAYSLKTIYLAYFPLKLKVGYQITTLSVRPFLCPKIA
jgi:hypothetical protein